MTQFQLISWSAIAPNLYSHAQWSQWALADLKTNSTRFDDKLPLPGVPAMLRRRFTDLGKPAALAAYYGIRGDASNTPCVFASRHGDTPLTLSILEDIADQAPLSPTSFGLAVHNAVSGLFSIAHKNHCSMTAIAASECLAINGLLEAAILLQSHKQVLCVIYDVPLPEIYHATAVGDPMPYAVALLLGHKGQHGLSLSQQPAASPQPAEPVMELAALIRLLCGHTLRFDTVTSSQQLWRVSSDQPIADTSCIPIQMAS